MDEAILRLQEVPSDRVLIVDGLAYGALDPTAVGHLRAPLIALVHHPLAYESSLAEPEVARLHDIERTNLEKVRHVIVPSPHVRAILISNYDVDAEHITVVRPGRTVEPAMLSGPRPDTAPLILSVGILHPRKGHDVLISALARLLDLDWQAVVVGSPWESGYDRKLRDRIETAGLGHRVRLTGWIEQHALDQLYHQAHVFALATRYEGHGMVFDEAMMHGLPIVSTTAGAVPQTVPRDAGLLVPPEDPGAFAAALRALFESGELHTAKARGSAKEGAALPTWEDAARRVGDILDHIATEEMVSHRTQ
ncbi:MAG: glycosyltransferase family 4 protein [Pseudomonadota bacterium]